jgi:hypothetical protein
LVGGRLADRQDHAVLAHAPAAMLFLQQQLRGSCAGSRAADKAAILQVRAGDRPAQVLPCQLSGFGHVVMPVPVSGNGTGSARFIRPGRRGLRSLVRTVGGPSK